MRLYDGVRLPYEDDTFDVVFSCFALEHLTDLSGCLGEMKRVLKTNGVMVHIVPTMSWRFWSNVMHYVGLAAEVRRGRLRSCRRLIPPRHGELTRNSVSEMFRYMLGRWRRTYSKLSLDVAAERPTHVFDVEGLLHANISLQVRTKLARLLGSSGYVFVLRKRDAAR